MGKTTEKVDGIEYPVVRKNVNADLDFVCVKCKFFYISPLDIKGCKEFYGRCTHPLLHRIEKGRSLVTGAKINEIIKKESCVTCREGGFCGKKGKYFEAKEPEDDRR